MPNVEFTDLLRRYFPDLQPTSVRGSSLYDIVTGLDEKFPGIRGYILDEQGRVRKHVAVAVDGDFVREKEAREITLGEQSNVMILQALSGG